MKTGTTWEDKYFLNLKEKETYSTCTGKNVFTRISTVYNVYTSCFGKDLKFSKHEKVLNILGGFLETRNGIMRYKFEV